MQLMIKIQIHLPSNLPFFLSNIFAEYLLQTLFLTQNMVVKMVEITPAFRELKI